MVIVNPLGMLRACRPRALALILGVSAAHAAMGQAAATGPATQPGAAPEPSAVETIRRDAQSLAPLVESELARRFLAATAQLPSIAPRSVYRDDATRTYYSKAAADRLSDDARGKLTERTIDERVYYNTKYGSPLAYVRPLDLLARAGMSDVRGKRILDFGYGTIGHLRLLASLGGDVVGVDVDSLLTAIYSEPADVGIIKGPGGAEGRITLVDGRFPADEASKAAVGDGYDLIISKNTLKNGYIHPERPTDPRKLIDLGVDDETFVRSLYNILKPGGRVQIYNLCPAPAPPDKEYIPWADGRSPFSRALWESAGFRVLAFDEPDDTAARAMGHALGWDSGPSPMNLENDLFGLYTLVEK